MNFITSVKCLVGAVCCVVLLCLISLEARNCPTGVSVKTTTDYKSRPKFIARFNYSSETTTAKQTVKNPIKINTNNLKNKRHHKSRISCTRKFPKFCRRRRLTKSQRQSIER